MWTTIILMIVSGFIGAMIISHQKKRQQEKAIKKWREQFDNSDNCDAPYLCYSQRFRVVGFSGEEWIGIACKKLLTTPNEPYMVGIWIADIVGNYLELIDGLYNISYWSPNKIISSMARRYCKMNNMEIVSQTDIFYFSTYNNPDKVKGELKIDLSSEYKVEQTIFWGNSTPEPTHPEFGYYTGNDPIKLGLVPLPDKATPLAFETSCSLINNGPDRISLKLTVDSQDDLRSRAWDYIISVARQLQFEFRIEHSKGWIAAEDVGLIPNTKYKCLRITNLLPHEAFKKLKDAASRTSTVVSFELAPPQTEPETSGEAEGGG